MDLDERVDTIFLVFASLTATDQRAKNEAVMQHKVRPLRTLMYLVMWFTAHPSTTLLD